MLWDFGIFRVISLCCFLAAKIYQEKGDYNMTFELICEGMEILTREDETSRITVEKVDVSLSTLKSVFSYPSMNVYQNREQSQDPPKMEEVWEGAGREVGKKKKGRTTLGMKLPKKLGVSSKFFSNQNFGFELLKLVPQRVTNKNQHMALQFWIAAAQLFFWRKDSNAASICASNAHQICPCSPDVMFLEANLKESQLKRSQLLALYHRILHIDPDHVETIIELACLHRAAGELLVAEKYLTRIVRRNPTLHKAWFLLGNIFLDKQEPDRATECFTLAVQLQATCPVLPFSIVNLFL